MCLLENVILHWWRYLKVRNFRERKIHNFRIFHQIVKICSLRNFCCLKPPKVYSREKKECSKDLKIWKYVKVWRNNDEARKKTYSEPCQTSKMKLFAILFAIWLSNSQLWVINEGYPQSADVNHCVLAINFRPEGHQEPCNEIGSLNPADQPIGNLLTRSQLLSHWATVANCSFGRLVVFPKSFILDACQGSEDTSESGALGFAAPTKTCNFNGGKELFS